MRPRKITDVKTFLVGGSWRNWLIVKMETDIDGLHGIGEATLEGRSATAETAVHELKRYLMDKDPFEIEKHFQELYRDEGLETHKAGTILFWAPDDPDTHVDIGGHIDTKARALVCHQSQNRGRTAEEAAEGISQRARQAAAGSQVEYAEAFRKVEFRR